MIVEQSLIQDYSMPQLKLITFAKQIATGMV